MGLIQLEMKLPEGKTCRDCVHHRRCSMLIGNISENTSCDWHPSRFVEMAVDHQAANAERRDG